MSLFHIVSPWTSSHHTAVWSHGLHKRVSTVSHSRLESLRFILLRIKLDGFLSLSWLMFLPYQDRLAVETVGNYSAWVWTHRSVTQSLNHWAIASPRACPRDTLARGQSTACMGHQSLGKHHEHTRCNLESLIINPGMFWEVGGN